MPYNKKTKFDGQTNLRVNTAKKDLLKQRGYILQDLLDRAMDITIDSEGLNDQETLQKIEEIDKQIRDLKFERSMLIDHLNTEKEKRRDIIKNKSYDELKAQYKRHWDFDEVDNDLIIKVATTFNLNKMELMNKVIKECRDEAREEANK